MSLPESVSCLVIACCILHNIAIRNGQELDLPDEIPPQPNDEVNYEEENEDLDREMPRNRLYYHGLRARNEIMEAYFHREN